jgi:hypothetical protein
MLVYSNWSIVRGDPEPIVLAVRLMFISSRPFAFLRDDLLRLISMQQMIGPLMKQLTELI